MSGDQLEGEEETSESAFALAETADEDARRYFESRRKKKILMFGSEERIDQITKRYTPLGRFRVIKKEETKTGLVFKDKTLVRKENTFYVDLARLELFYIRKGMLGRASGIERSDILQILDDLPKEARDLLLDLMEFGSVTYEQLCNDLDEKQRILLMQRGLIESYTSRSEELMSLASDEASYGYPRERVYVRSKVHIPKFEDRCYDLASFLREGPINGSYTKDSIEFSTEEASELLEELFLGEAVFEGIIYMPYYLCRYLSGTGKSTSERYDVYFPLQFL
ncbi:MAG TPA: hypothetical protein ENG12_03440 [Candidatus Altiarchaeales archaeon]|nr:hypothetical protein [Candidatus Altiarchaeales archaeon]